MVIDTDIIETIRKRRSIREYGKKPLSEKDIKSLFEATRLAPSWANKQCWKFIVVKDEKLKDEIRKTTGKFTRTWLKDVPLIIVGCGDPAKSGSHYGLDYYAVDVAIAMQNLILAATDLGLGTCWIGSFDEAKIKELLDIPEEIRVVGLTPVGYPKTGFVDKTIGIAWSGNRKELKEIVCYDKWRN